MQIKTIDKKEVWEDFLVNVEEKSFLQSWNWGVFQKKMGRKIWRFGIFDKKLIATAFVQKIKAKRGTFLLLPHGPSLIKIFPPATQNTAVNNGLKIKHELLKVLLAQLKLLAKREKASFIRVSPIWKRTKQNIEIFRKTGFRPAPIHIHPEASWVLDITPSETELLKNMRKSTRYEIRKSLKDEKIEISLGSNKDLELFAKLHKKTARRHSFVPFSLNYFEKEFSCFNRDNEALLYVAKHEGKIAAMAFIIFWSKMAFYHHAVLDPEFHNKHLSCRILWEAIKQAKKRGISAFDFWGYAPPKSNHPWAGPTLFKTGFGGIKKEYVKTQDHIISPLYWLDYAIETIRKKKRGFANV